MLLVAGCIVCSGIVAPRARAACCENPWRCLAAVATGGLSCAIEEAVRTITGFVAAVENLRTALASQIEHEKRAAMTVTATQANGELEQSRFMKLEAAAALEQVDAAHADVIEYHSLPRVGVALAAPSELEQFALRTPVRIEAPLDETGTPVEIVSTDVGLSLPLLAASRSLADLARAVGAPADPTRELAVLESAKRKADELRNDIDVRQAAEVTGRAETLRLNLDANLVAVDAALAVGVLVPLGSLVATMPPDPLIAVAAIGGLLATLEQIRSDFAAQVVPLSHEMAQSMAADTEQLKNQVDTMRNEVEELKTLAAAAKRLSGRHLQFDLERVEALLDLTSSHSVHEG